MRPARIPLGGLAPQDGEIAATAIDSATGKAAETGVGQAITQGKVVGAALR